MHRIPGENEIPMSEEDRAEIRAALRRGQIWSVAAAAALSGGSVLLLDLFQPGLGVGDTFRTLAQVLFSFGIVGACLMALSSWLRAHVSITVIGLTRRADIEDMSMVVWHIPRLLADQWAQARPGSKIGLASIGGAVLCVATAAVTFIVTPEAMQGWIGWSLGIAIPLLILLGAFIYIGQNFLPDGGYRPSRELREAYRELKVSPENSEHERSDAPKK